MHTALHVIDSSQYECTANIHRHRRRQIHETDLLICVCVRVCVRSNLSIDIGGFGIIFAQRDQTKSSTPG